MNKNFQEFNLASAVYGEDIKEEFNLGEYLSSLSNISSQKEMSTEKLDEFYALCKKVVEMVRSNDLTEQNEKLTLERHKRAIIGYPDEVNYYKVKIEDALKELGAKSEWSPAWYDDIVDAIFNESWGIPAGISRWVKGDGPYKKSSSAKILGDRLYFMLDGEMVLQPQRISKERREQFRSALLLDSPEKRRGAKYIEVYLLDGTRVTIFNEPLTKRNQDCIVFRKFLVQQLTFESQADFHTIPRECIPMLKDMVKVGMNVAFVGPVRSAKTTFLSTWQSYENPKLEGVLIETDPEIPIHTIMPSAPIMQLIVNDEDTQIIVKQMMRSDADYLVLGEARSGDVLQLAVKLANKGTRRVKITYHTSDALDFCNDVTHDIVQACGGDYSPTVVKTAKSFQYVFQFVQLPNKSQKRLKGIYEVSYDAKRNEIAMVQICKYRYLSDDWVFHYNCFPDKEIIGEEEDLAAFIHFKDELKKLSELFPDDNPTEYRYSPKGY